MNLPVPSRLIRKLGASYCTRKSNYEIFTTSHSRRQGFVMCSMIDANNYTVFLSVEGKRQTIFLQDNLLYHSFHDIGGVHIIMHKMIL